MSNVFSPEQYLSKTAREIKPSGIRKFFDVAATMPDVISLGVGSGGNSLLVPPSCLSSHNSPGT